MKKTGIMKIIAVTLATGMLMLTGCHKNESVQIQVQTEEATDDTTIRVGALKGPTTLGLLPMLKKEDAKVTVDFQMMTTADELLPLMIKGELDIALVPSNVASVLYHKTEGGIQVININTLSVLYLVSGNTEITTPSGLTGKTIYLTGKGTTPDYALHHVLAQNGLNEGDYTLEYKSEATEVAAVLTETPDAIGLLPQPFATVACAQNDQLAVIMDLGKEWEAIDKSSSIVTGVTVVRKAFMEEHKELVEQFIKEHIESAEKMNENMEEGAALAVEAGIIPKEPIARKAIPNCNIVCITGQEMKTRLSGYLQVLFEQNPASVGGEIPGDDFYLVK